MKRNTVLAAVMTVIAVVAVGFDGMEAAEEKRKMYQFNDQDELIRPCH